MSSDDRRLAVLRAIVQDYVQTREPVGSRTLVERHALGVSPATVRNDMAFLEEAGLIAQPHTSAGRVPTDKGYRLFVDRLSEVKPLSAPERRAIQAFLDEAVDLDDVVDRSVRLLAQLTQQVAVVQYPSLRRSALRHLELVPVGEHRMLVVIITDTGRVEQRVIEAVEPVTEVVVHELRARLNAAVAGRRLVDLARPLEETVEAFPPEDRPLVRQVVTVVEDTLGEATEERIVMAGASHPARRDNDFTRTSGPGPEELEGKGGRVRPVAEMAEERGGGAARVGDARE